MALLFILLFLQASLYAQAQRNITSGSTLNTQDQKTSWISPSGEFAFGFRPLDTDASSYLVAIWFNKMDTKTVVWYANGNLSVPDGSQLQLTTDGVFLLRNPAGEQLWNPGVTNVDHAIMLDTGNFVLYGKDGSTKWQSFSYPTDTILPSQALQAGTVLRSQLMDTDYLDGRFVLSVEVDGNLRFYTMAIPSSFRYDPPYWDSNTGGNGSSLVFNESGKIYYTLNNGGQLNITSAALDSPSEFYLRATLDSDGVFRQYMYPKAALRNGWSLEWQVLNLLPRNICKAVAAQIGSGACGLNSYCTFSTNKSADCECPPYYSFIDSDRRYKGCKQDFAPHSCGLDEAESVEQFELRRMININWPFGDYE